MIAAAHSPRNNNMERMLVKRSVKHELPRQRLTRSKTSIESTMEHDRLPMTGTKAAERSDQ
ncbi:hypothetical protein AC1031_016629 [Aphanomyces cochlioides]|nr:hypothetical protein AC1031_016629 [Aphanomyces cochlioides]